MINQLPCIVAARDQQVYIVLGVGVAFAALAASGVAVFPPRWRKWGALAVTVIAATCEVALLLV